MRRLAAALRERSWEVEVWTTTAFEESTWRENGFSPGRTLEEGVAVRRFPLRAHRAPRAFAQLSRAFFRIPTSCRPERLWTVLQGPYSPALIRALATADSKATLFTPYLYHPTLLGVGAAPHPRIVVPAAHNEPALSLRITGRALRRADALFFHTPEEAELVHSVHPGTVDIPFATGIIGVQAPARVDTRAFSQGLSLKGPYLYHGGRSAAGKRDGLLEAFAALHALHSEVKLVLSGESEGGLLPSGVIHVGRLSDDERWAAIAGALAVVVPGRLESLSLLALESWAMARPCLLNAQSPVLRGHAQRGGGGLLYQDGASFVAAVSGLMEDPTRAMVIGRRGRDYVHKNYTWDAVEQRLLYLLGIAAS